MFFSRSYGNILEHSSQKFRKGSEIFPILGTFLNKVVQVPLFPVHGPFFRSRTSIIDIQSEQPAASKETTFWRGEGLVSGKWLLGLVVGTCWEANYAPDLMNLVQTLAIQGLLKYSYLMHFNRMLIQWDHSGDCLLGQRMSFLEQYGCYCAVFLWFTLSWGSKKQTFAVSVFK